MKRPCLMRLKKTCLISQLVWAKSLNRRKQNSSNIHSPSMASVGGLYKSSLCRDLCFLDAGSPVELSESDLADRWACSWAFLF